MRILILPAQGKTEKVGQSNAVDGGDEGDGDTTPDLGDVVEVLHDLDQAENGSDDSDRGRETSRGFENLRDVFFVFSLVIQLEFHHLLKLLRLGAVNGQHQRLFQEGIFDLLDFAIERNDAFLAGFLRVAHDFADLQMRILALVEEDRSHLAEGVKHDRQGEN